MQVKARAYQHPGVEFPSLPAGQNGTDGTDRNMTRFDLALLPNWPTKTLTKFRHAGVKFRLLTFTRTAVGRSQREKMDDAPFFPRKIINVSVEIFPSSSTKSFKRT